jgi:pimeloyl-ACP methyl ester carboxylesterase
MALDTAPFLGHDLADHPPIEGQQLAALRAEDVTSELHEISAPTLVVSAAHDPIAPPALGRALATAIPGARYELLSDQAHGAPILAAETVNALLLAHLDRVETVRAMGAAVAGLGADE